MELLKKKEKLACLTCERFGDKTRQRHRNTDHVVGWSPWQPPTTPHFTGNTISFLDFSNFQAPCLSSQGLFASRRLNWGAEFLFIALRYGTCAIPHSLHRWLPFHATSRDQHCRTM